MTDHKINSQFTNMENDYLWDKTGEDAEIEQLERTLQVFRYQESNAPLLPVKVVETKPKFSLYTLRFALSFAACILFLVSGIFVWSKLILQQNSAETAVNQNSIQRHEIKLNVPKVVLPPDTPETYYKPNFTTKTINVGFRQKQFITPVIRKATRKKVTPKVQLTDEEQFAYNQLMLALSITGSKFKEVRDKANGDDGVASTVNSLK